VDFDCNGSILMRHNRGLCTDKNILFYFHAHRSYIGTIPQRDGIPDKSGDSTMNKNVVLNWDRATPTEPGLYLACYGGVVSPDNIRLVHFVARGEGHLMTADGLWPEDFGPVYTWARLLVGSEAQRFVEGE
jgi:hypothetical protein